MSDRVSNFLIGFSAAMIVCGIVLLIRHVHISIDWH